MAVNRGRRTKAQSIVAPVGGLNDSDSIADMPPRDALTLTNWFPGTREISVRGGSELWTDSGITDTIETLMPYNGNYGGVDVDKIFAAADGSIYDVTSTGAATAVVTGKSNNRWEFVNYGFATAGGNFLVAVNGEDMPIFYNGNAWTYSGAGSYATAITGVTASKFTHVSIWKERLFFVETNSLRCWFLGVKAIGGAASVLDFAPFCRLGGNLVATGTLTSSAGVTMDDYFFAITSEGECLVYRGTDPSDAAKFALVGSYRIGRPITGTEKRGGRWLSKFGADIVAITADGFTTLQQMFNADVIAMGKTINDKIVNSVTKDVQAYKANFGWQIILCPIQNKLIINIPTTELSQAHQYVMNTVTGAWCKFTGWNATCFGYFNDEIYAAIGNKVYKVDQIGKNDGWNDVTDNTPISADAKTAFVFFGGRGQLKQYQMARALLSINGIINPKMNINVDLKDELVDGDLDLSSEDFPSLWGDSLWDSAVWGSGLTYIQNWFNVNGLGYCAAMKIQVSVNNNICNFSGWEIMYDKGGLI